MKRLLLSQKIKCHKTSINYVVGDIYWLTDARYYQSVAKVLLSLSHMFPFLLENEKKYDKSAYYHVDR